ncbi:MAG: IPT/TIG domain-containing protein [Planctomycetes bacterium]|nr:IPT/TIG domain-containing protein [Planctomycetota bacterium]
MIAIAASGARADTTRLVSVDSDGRPANSRSFVRGISSNGRYVLFDSAATNLVPDDTNGVRDAFVRDRIAGTTTRVNVNSSGEQANVDCFFESLSADGLHVAFASAASNLVPGDDNGVLDVFVHDLPTGETTRVSVASDGSESNGSSGYLNAIWYDAPSVAISGDGRFICFWSAATNLAVTNACVGEALYVHDRRDSSTTLLLDRTSIDPCGGTRLAVRAFDVEMSANGESITFRTWGLGGGHALYVDLYLLDRRSRALTPIRDDGHLSLFTWPSISANGRFVAFDGSILFDQTTGQSRVVDVDSSGNRINGGYSSLSPDGRFLVFIATDSGEPPPTSNRRLIREDLATGEAVRLGLVGTASYARHFPCSEGAAAIAFQTDLSLVPEDVDLEPSVYVEDVVLLSAARPAVGSEAGGDFVNLEGGWFADVTDLRVRVGDMDARVVNVAGTRVRVLTPPGSGTVDVTVATRFDSATIAGAYSYVAPEIAARYGNVSVGRGDREDVLLLNATAGDPATREVSVGAEQPITLVMLSPSSRATARYVLYGWSGLPNVASLTPLPRDVGGMVFPTPITGGTPQPAVVWNVFGHRRALGSPTLPSQLAPSIVISRPRGAASSTNFTLQGLIEDDASPSGLGLSVTNALLVQVRP